MDILPPDESLPLEEPVVEPVVTEQAVTDVPAIPARPPATNVQQDAEVYSPLEGKWNPNDISLNLAADNHARTEAFIADAPNVKMDDTVEGREWADVLRSSSYTTPHKDWFENTVTRPDSKFRQGVQSERGLLSAAAPSFRDPEGVKLTGERAVLRVRSLIGMGSIVQIPLWHSGFWLTLKAPSEGAMLELNRRLIEEKISLGRFTYGLAFANNSVFFAGWIMDFALSHVYDSSLKDTTNIRSKISSLDIPLIAWGLACAIWPKGFQYARAILNNEGQQTRVVREKLNVGKLLWTDTSSLTPWQIAHMAARHGSTMTDEAVARYRSEFTRGQGREITLSENLKLTLAVPSLDQYLTSGQRWVNNIVAMVDKAFTMSSNDGVRDDYIMDQGKATNMRQFSHWVQSLNAGGSQIDDIDTLDQTFDSLSSRDDLRKVFFDGVQKFIEDSTMAVVAVPIVDTSEKSELPRFPHLLPLDVLSTFFILLVQKAQHIRNRDQ